MEVIAILVLTVWSVVVSYNEAPEDARAIKENKEIDHAKELKERIMLVFPVTVLVSFGLCWSRWELWPALPLIAISWASFTAPFRFVLNRKRGLDWRYVSPSNWYDWQFIVFAWYLWGNRTAIRKYRESVVKGWYSGEIDRQEDAHRAGLLAYILETTVLALAIAALLFINTT